MINTENYSQAQVLKALFNNSKPQGMGILNFMDRNMSLDEAKEIIDSGQTYFDYHEGRVMKVNLIDFMQFEEAGYDRDNGHGAAQRAIDSIGE